jgi:arginase
MTPPPRFALIGVPWDGSSSFERGAALAPPLIRRALASASTNASTEAGDDVDLSTFTERGDLALGDDAAAARVDIERAVRAEVAAGLAPIVLGGDHSITYPVLRAFHDRPVATILHIDAHGDLYDEFPAFPPTRLHGASARQAVPDGASARLRQVPGQRDRFSHACPFARIMEDGLTRRLVQIGIRTATPHLKHQAERFGVEVYGMERWQDAPVEALDGPVYVSLDLDGLDPAFAPGVAHPEPGGLSTRDVVSVLHRLRAPIAGADIVEYNPRNDVRDLTARVAAKLLKELVAVAIRNQRG